MEVEEGGVWSCDGTAVNQCGDALDILRGHVVVVGVFFSCVFFAVVAACLSTVLSNPRKPARLRKRGDGSTLEILRATRML